MRFTHVLLMASLSLIDLGCGRTCEVPWHSNFTSLPVKVSGRTPDGLLLDDPEQQLDQAEIDRITKQVVACVRTAGRTEANLCADTPALGRKIEGCLVIKVPEWHYSQCTNEQVFSCSVPAASCEAKGQFGPCPCSCRAIIQDGYVIITAPNHRLYAGALTQYLTGCWYVWTGELETCAGIQ
jgi:hypothetical protein